MLKKDLIKLLEDLDDDAEITVIDPEQNYCWSIQEVRTTDGMTNYADIVINY